MVAVFFPLYQTLLFEFRQCVGGIVDDHFLYQRIGFFEVFKPLYPSDVAHNIIKSCFYIAILAYFIINTKFFCFLLYTVISFNNALNE